MTIDTELTTNINILYIRVDSFMFFLFFFFFFCFKLLATFIPVLASYLSSFSLLLQKLNSSWVYQIVNGMLVFSYIPGYFIINVMFYVTLFAFQANIKVEETAPGVTTGMILSLRERYHQFILIKYKSPF